MAIQLSDHFSYKRLLKFVFPSIIMMVFTSIYGVVDGLFVSNIVGKAAFAAINLIMPVNMIFGGIGFMLGTGGSALVAKTLGEKDPEKANRYFTMMILITAIIGVITSAIGIGIMRPVSLLLGADDAMLPNCILYGRIMMAFNVSFMLQNAFQGFLITAEKPSMGLAVTVVAGITNMILDALFIGVFHWGVAGAAFATGLSSVCGRIDSSVLFPQTKQQSFKACQNKIGSKTDCKSLHQWFFGNGVQRYLLCGGDSLQFSAFKVCRAKRSCFLWGSHVCPVYFGCYIHWVFYGNRTCHWIPLWRR